MLLKDSETDLLSSSPCITLLLPVFKGLGSMSQPSLMGIRPAICDAAACCAASNICCPFPRAKLAGGMPAAVAEAGFSSTESLAACAPMMFGSLKLCRCCSCCNWPRDDGTFKPMAIKLLAFGKGNGSIWEPGELAKGEEKSCTCW